MSRARVAIVLSVAVHGVAVAAIAAHTLEAPATRETVATLVVPPEETIDVVLLPPDVEPVVSSNATPSGGERPRQNQISTTRRASSSQPTERAGSGPIDNAALAAAAGAIGYRPGVEAPQPQAPATTLAMSGAAIEKFLANSKPLEVIPESGRIQQNGRALIVPDLQVPATINDDGTVKFHDQGDFEAHWAIHIPSGKEIGDRIADWYKDPYAQTVFRKVQDMAPHEQAVEGGWDAGAGGDGRPDGKAEQPGHSKQGAPQIPIVGGGFDVTAWAMRKFGAGDPYSARKMKLLAQTFDERAEIGAQHVARQLASSSQIAQGNLRWIAQIADPKARHQALFDMWDECVEGDGRQAEAGQRARVMIIGYIRAHETLSPSEIAAFDKVRTSTQHFAPYR